MNSIYGTTEYKEQLVRWKANKSVRVLMSTESTSPINFTNYTNYEDRPIPWSDDGQDGGPSIHHEDGQGWLSACEGLGVE
jgi:hypothetical protein